LIDEAIRIMMVLVPMLTGMTITVASPQETDA
jgi:hypothetical protein